MALNDTTDTPDDSAPPPGIAASSESPTDSAPPPPVGGNADDNAADKIAPPGSTVNEAVRKQVITDATTVTAGGMYNGVKVPQGAVSVAGGNWIDNSGAVIPNEPYHPDGSINENSTGFYQQWNQNLLDKGVNPMIAAEILKPGMDAAIINQNAYNANSEALLNRAILTKDLQDKNIAQRNALYGVIAAAEQKAPGVGGASAAATIISGLDSGDASGTVVKQVFPGYDPTKPTQSVANIVSASAAMGAGAGTAQKKAQVDIEAQQQSIAASKISAAVQQGQLQASIAGDLGNTVQGATRAGTVLRTVGQVTPLDDAITKLYAQLPAGQRTGQLSYDALPGPLAALAKSSGLIGADKKVQLPALISAANSQQGMLEATTLANEGVAGGMGSDARSNTVASGAGKISLTADPATFAQIMKVRKAFQDAATGSATTILNSNNARSQMLLNAGAKAGSPIDPTGIIIPAPAPSTLSVNTGSTPAGPRTVTNSEVEAYRQKYGLSNLGVAADQLSKRGYTVPKELK